MNFTNKKTALLIAACMALGTNASAQKGALDKNVLSKIENSYKNSPTDKALRNAVLSKGMKDLVVNSEKGLPLDDNFTYKIESKGISNQQSSGRCWLFTGLNVLRSKVIKKDNTGPFFFSQNYNFFFDQLEKSNLFLQGIIDTKDKAIDDKMVEWLFKNPIGDGGQFTGVSENLMKYGVVPSDIFPETTNSNNTRELGRILTSMLRTSGINMREAFAKGADDAKLEDMKINALQKIYKVLVMNLGLPPKEFEYTLRDDKGKVISTKKYTPQSFYKEFVGLDLKNDYVMVMNDPSREFNKLYEIEFDRHNYDGKNWTYVNLPMGEIKEMAIASIKGGDMMYYSCDVGKELDRNTGVLSLSNFDYPSLIDFDLNMDKKQRIQTFESGSTHAMTLMAVNIGKNGKPDKWMVENSWGANNGAKGHLIMSDEWFDAYTFRLVINKKYITSKVKSILKMKPVVLPPWDPMFKADN